MENSPAFQFYAQDFLTGVMYLTNEEIGMYIKMLCKQWTDSVIPKKRLGFLIGKDWDSLSEELKSKFEDKGEHLVNKRLEAERVKKLNFKKKQSINGSKGGRGNKKQSEAKPKIKPNQSQKKPLENENENEERSKKYEKEKEIEVEIEIYPTFDDFWMEYDKKVSKDKSQKLWKKLKQQDKEDVMAYIPHYKQSRPEKQFRKGPDSFLLNKTWHDEIIKNQDNGTKAEQRTDTEIFKDAMQKDTAKQFKFS